MMRGLVIIDIRAADAYTAGQITQAINIPAGFYVNTAPEDMAPGGSFMELPPQEDPFELLGNAGIGSASTVVVVGDFAPAPNPPYVLSDATRVIDTLIYAGVKNVGSWTAPIPPGWLRASKRAPTCPRLHR